MNEKPLKIILRNQIPPSNKEYQVILEKDTMDTWSVMAWNGRIGSTLVPQPKCSGASYEYARNVYDTLVQEKISKKQYTVYEGKTPDFVAPKGVKTASNASGMTKVVLTGYMPQLLNEISEVEAQALICNNDWIMNEKDNGKNTGLSKKAGDITASNKKGQAVGMSVKTMAAATMLDGDFEMGGESVGDRYIANDIYSLNGEDLRDLDYETRFNILKDFVKNSAAITVTKYAKTTAEKKKLWDWLKSNNREGAVFKLKKAKFTPGRPTKGGSQLKCKFWVMCTALVGKHNQKRSVQLQMLKGSELVDVGNVTISPNKEVPPVGSLVEITYLYIAAIGGSLYQPEFLEIRDDQDKPDDVSTLKVNNSDTE